MKHLLVIPVMAALAGCATYPDQRYAQPADPAQWRVVSVTPVPAGTAARVAATSPSGKAEEFSSTPVTVAPLYAPAPGYALAPVYAPAPLYYDPPVYWPPVSLSLGFVFGKHWSSGHRHGHGRGHFRGRRR